MSLPDKLELIDGGFSYEKKKYSFSDVVSLEMYATSVKHSLNFVKTHNSLHAQLHIFFSNKKLGKKGKLTIGANKGFFTDLRNYETQKRLTDALHNFHKIIADATFDNRVQNYLATGDDTIAFRYGKFAFFKDGVIVKNGALFVVIDRDKYSMKLGYSDIIFEKKGLLGKTTGELFGKKTIEILKDKDAVLTLLNHFYGLRW